MIFDLSPIGMSLCMALQALWQLVIIFATWTGRRKKKKKKFPVYGLIPQT
jgi:hypothetical protein